MGGGTSEEDSDLGLEQPSSDMTVWPVVGEGWAEWGGSSRGETGSSSWGRVSLEVGATGGPSWRPAQPEAAATLCTGRPHPAQEGREVRLNRAEAREAWNEQNRVQA